MTITVGGTSITFNDATTQSTAGITSAVTSAVAGNGVAVSGATGAVTFSVAAPSWNSVGSYTWGGNKGNGANAVTYTANSNYAAGGGVFTTGVRAWPTFAANGCCCGSNSYYSPNNNTSNLSGTWKWMNPTTTSSTGMAGLVCRVA